MKKKKFNNYDLEQLRRICKKNDIKLTHQRLEIFKELMSAVDHPSAEVIFLRLRVRIPTLSIDTVYRTLATFDELGMVRRLQLANKRNLFDNNLTPHHHFVCDRCQKIEDVYWPDLDKNNLPAKVVGKKKIQSLHLELYGLCNICLEENGE